MKLRLVLLVLLVAAVPGGAAPSLAVPKVVAGATNIAAAVNGGHIVAYSSQALDENEQVMPEWQVANLIDGKYVIGSHVPPDSYGWSSQSVPSEEAPEWIVLAFEGNVTKLISRLVIDPTTADPSFIGRAARYIKVEVSTTTPDGPYKLAARILVDNRPVKQAFDLVTPVEAKHVRLVITSNHGSDKCVEMGEVEIYEAIAGEHTLDQLIVQLENLLAALKEYRDAQLYQQEQQTLREVTSKPGPPATTPEATSTAPEE